MVGGGLVVWSELRRPRDLRLEIDLTEALPGDVVELDVTVTRGGQALLRLDQRYGSFGAPATTSRFASLLRPPGIIGSNGRAFWGQRQPGQPSRAPKACPAREAR